MESAIENLRKQVKELCSQIEKRIKEIGDVDILTYRSDPQIKELRRKICDLYREAVNKCRTYGEALKVCEVFKEYPTCLAQLMLSEELTCPAPTGEK
mgnify:CR=1 FL=1|jgi:hypothetical protein